MAEELQESDVIFSDRDDHGTEDNFFNFNSCRRGRTPTKYPKRSEMAAKSLPVGIPGRIERRKAEGGDEMDGDEMVPPHVVAERRVAGKMAFSVCTGNGRTLKGRDLSRVRNSILRMTGFLET